MSECIAVASNLCDFHKIWNEGSLNVETSVCEILNLRLFSYQLQRNFME